MVQSYHIVVNAGPYAAVVLGIVHHKAERIVVKRHCAYVGYLAVGIKTDPHNRFTAVKP